MPYNYLTINEQDLGYGIVSASYLSTDLQSLYEQKISNSERFFGDINDDVLEFSLYNSNQEPISFNRVIPSVTYNVFEKQFRDVNDRWDSYSVKIPDTNYKMYNNNVLLHTQFDLKFNQVGTGLYYLLYNPTRNLAGNVNNKLFIKEISPSRTELRLSYAFNADLNESSRIDSTKISAFASKKYLFLQILSDSLSIINLNPVDKTFNELNFQSQYYKISSLLGFKTIAELQTYISSIYIGYNKIVNLSTDIDSQILQTQSFIGIKEQLNNFLYKYNNINFTRDEILKAIKLIVIKVSQSGILRKTTLTDIDLQDIINVFVEIIYTRWLLPQFTTLLDEYDIKFFGLYKNALNFDNGNLVKILSHTSYFNPIDNRINIQIKLDEPLPSHYNLKTTCWVSNISIMPVYFKVILYSTPISRKVYLNGVNFSVNLGNVRSSSEKLSVGNENTLIYAKSKLKIKQNDLLINYDAFDNFINFSSAELRSKIAKKKIITYVNLESKKTVLSTRSSISSTSISASYSVELDIITQEQINLLNSFDEYESHLFFNTSSLDDKIIDGAIYDKTNYNGLSYQLPEYIKSDTEYEDYIKFTAMIGHFFDNILIFIKKFPKTYSITYDDNNDYPKNYIEELLNSLNWDVTNIKFDKSGLTQLLFNSGEMSNSLSSSYFDYTKSIFNRLVNNLPNIYKTKGTSNSFELIRNLFGIAPELISVTEYGSTDVYVNRQSFNEFETPVYAVKFESDDNFIKFDYEDPDFKLVNIQRIFSCPSNVCRLTQSFIETFSGLSTVELSFRSNKYDNYNFQDKIPIIKKLRNNKIDWQIYLYKSKQQKSANLIFEFTPFESNITSSIKSDELPYFNGDFYTCMIKREIFSDIYVDVLPTINNKSQYTSSFTSSTATKYVPHTYTLAVNQYYGNSKRFSSTSNKTILYDQNQYFSSGSYYIGNFSSSKPFCGNIDKIKTFKTVLSNEDFEEHSYNLNSISTDDKSAIYSNLYHLWSFDTPINLWSNNECLTASNQNTYYKNSFYAYNFDRSTVKRGAPNCDTILTDIFPYQFEKILVKQSINSNKFGPNYKINSKINKINSVVDSTLVPYVTSTHTSDKLSSDSNLIGYFISPYTYLNDKIEDFLGKDGITDILGDPKYLKQNSYPELKTRRKEFSSLDTKYIYPQEFYSTYKFYIDFSIFEFVKKLNPSRSNLKSGLLLEPSLLERFKFTYKDINVSSINPDNSSNLLYFNNSQKFTASLINTNDTSSFGLINLTSITDSTSDVDTYNYSRIQINDRIDNRDFIYSKYGKYIFVDNNGFNVRNVVNIPTEDFYTSHNSTGTLVTFTSSYNTINIIGSGSVTGSNALKSFYSGSFGSGYSVRHLYRSVRFGTRVRKQAIKLTDSITINGVQTKKSGVINYYTYVKSKNDVNSTINRKGLPNGSQPIISIPGFLSLNIVSDNVTTFGTLTGSIIYPNSIFVQSPLTASLETSASLNNYIMNL